MLETIGSVADFQNVVKKIPGMEWLGDFDAEAVAGDPGFLADGADPALQSARLFVLASNRTAYTEVLRLWNLWLRAGDDKIGFGYGKLAEAFKSLNDVRAWGPKDRVLATGVVASWERGLASNEPTIRFEAELWCRADAGKRAAAYRVADLWFDPPSTRLSVKRTDADHDAVTRGSVQHEVLEGTSAVAIVDGDLMPVQVNCRAEASTKVPAPISYALLVSLETARPLAVSIYDQVKARIAALHAPVQVRPRR